MIQVEREQVVKFKYNKNGVATDRILLVKDHDRDHIEGLDAHKNEHRKFLKKNISGLKVLAGSKEGITPLHTEYWDNLTGKRVSGQEVADCALTFWSELYDKVRYEEDIDALVLTPKAPKAAQLSVVVDHDHFYNGGFVSLVFGDKVVTLYISSEGNVVDILVEGRSVGNDVYALASAVEVLAGE